MYFKLLEMTKRTRFLTNKIELPLPLTLLSNYSSLLLPQPLMVLDNKLFFQALYTQYAKNIESGNIEK